MATNQNVSNIMSVLICLMFLLLYMNLCVVSNFIGTCTMLLFCVYFFQLVVLYIMHRNKVSQYYAIGFTLLEILTTCISISFLDFNIKFQLVNFSESLWFKTEYMYMYIYFVYLYTLTLGTEFHVSCLHYLCIMGSLLSRWSLCVWAQPMRDGVKI